MSGPQEAKTQEDILMEARRITNVARQKAYGHPVDDFTRTGRMWAAILNMPHVSPQQVAMCMIAVKISREVNSPGRDNRVDIAGYVNCLDMVVRRLELPMEAPVRSQVTEPCRGDAADDTY
jgi:hypothetical protein